LVPSDPEADDQLERCRLLDGESGGLFGTQVMVPPEGFARLAQQPIEILIAA
jgi:hypothetical protein